MYTYVYTVASADKVRRFLQSQFTMQLLDHFLAKLLVFSELSSLSTVLFFLEFISPQARPQFQLCLNKNSGIANS